jgi:hypothetical protein
VDRLVIEDIQNQVQKKEQDKVQNQHLQQLLKPNKETCIFDEIYFCHLPVSRAFYVFSVLPFCYLNRRRYKKQFWYDVFEYIRYLNNEQGYFDKFVERASK